jgi:anti-sigma factor RsiW
MTCREFADFLAEYLAGELPSGVQVRFEEHIAVCPNCVRYLAQYRESIALGRQAFQNLDGGLSSDVPEDLVAAILTARVG